MSPEFRGFELVLPGGEGWAGKGWEGSARSRPYSLFGFAAKIHDFNYHLNQSSFPTVDSGKSSSRRAKADYIFRKMNELVKDHLLFGGDFWFPLAKVGFIGKSPKEFCPNDGFVNAISKKELDDPERYLMIPFTELTIKPLKTERIWNGPYYSDVKVPDLLRNG